MFCWNETYPLKCAVTYIHGGNYFQVKILWSHIKHLITKISLQVSFWSKLFNLSARCIKSWVSKDQCVILLNALSPLINKYMKNTLIQNYKCFKAKVIIINPRLRSHGPGVWNDFTLSTSILYKSQIKCCEIGLDYFPKLPAVWQWVIPRILSWRVVFLLQVCQVHFYRILYRQADRETDS